MVRRITFTLAATLLLGLISALPAATVAPSNVAKQSALVASSANAAGRTMVVTGLAFCRVHFATEQIPEPCSTVTLSTDFGGGYRQPAIPRISPFGGVRGSYRFEGVPVGEHTDFDNDVVYTVTAEAKAGVFNDSGVGYYCISKFTVKGAFQFIDQHDDWFGPWSIANPCNEQA
jgi:hypothetical protein